MRRDIQRVALAAIALSTLQGSAAALPPAAPARAQSCQVELVVDQPGENAEITVRQRISGWAVDRTAADGTGIEAMRVALDPPESPDEQVFLPLVYGVARPDVAYTLGSPRFARAGFAQEWAAVGTPPGRHRLVIQAKSACGWTTISRTIRVLPASAGADTIQEVLVPLLNNDGSGRLTISAPASPIAPGAPVNALERTPPVPLAVTRQHFPLTAEATGPTSARLTWDAMPGATTYNVYQADESVATETPNPQNVMRLFGLGGLQRARSGVAETSAILTGLNAGARYRFTVRAVSEAGGEINASEVARITLPGGPSPNTLTASATGGPGSVALSWTTVADAATYTVLSGASGGLLVADPQRTHLTATSANLDRLPPGTYTFQIEARDAAGARLARSNPAQVTVDPTGSTSAAVLSSSTAPGVADALSGPSASTVPAALVPSAAVPGAPPGALAPPPGAPPSAFGPPPGAPPGAFVPPVPGPAGVAPGAMLPPGAPPGGPLPALGVPGGPPAPGAGLQVRALRAGPDSARLEWPQLPGVAAYAVYQAQGDTPLALAFTTSQPTTTLVGLTRGISYSFQVRARNGADQDVAVSPPVTLTLDQ